MPQITMRVSAKVYKSLQDEAEKVSLTVTDYMLSKALPNYLKKSLTVQKVLTKLPAIKRDTEFSLKDLYTDDEWEDFAPGSRISTGRLFLQDYKKGHHDLPSIVSYSGKNSANLAKYIKL
jgi:hypothetical protein